jgi:diacylglycerol kinase (ATP)
MTNQTIVLYNPLSNEGQAKRDLENLTKRYASLFQSVYSLLEINNLPAFLKEKAPDVVVIAGGDGAINTVTQATLKLSHQPKLAILPLGFGNALSYCLGVETLEKAVAVLQNPKHSVALDVMKTNLSQIPIGLFNISVGFDARIVHNRITHRYIGFWSYFLSTFRSFLFHPHSEITFTIDHSVKLSALASSLMVASGPIIGYNYLVAPQAKLNDGLLDCTLFSTKYDYLTNLRLRGFKHPLYSRLGKVHFKAKHIKIEGEPYVQIDGDPVEQRGGLEISVAEKQVTFFYNKSILSNKEYMPFRV